jgi:hypothetical protein
MENQYIMFNTINNAKRGMSEIKLFQGNERIWLYSFCLSVNKNVTNARLNLMNKIRANGS